MFAICHIGVICMDRNTIAGDELQVAIKYTSDLAVSKFRGQIASIFSKGRSSSPQASVPREGAYV